MSKTLRKIITLILVLVMLFGVSAVTIGAATAEGGGTSGGLTGSQSSDSSQSAGGSSGEGNNNGGETGTSGSLTTGWLDISYDTVTNEIVVVLSPDKGAILDIDKAELQEILAMLVEAMKEVVLDDVLSDFGGLTILEEELTPDNILEKVLDIYLDKHYSGDDKRMEFIKEVLNSEVNAETGEKIGDERIKDFAHFMTELVRAAVLIKPELKKLLPDPAKINSFIEEKLENILNTEIDNYLHDLVEQYIKYIDDGSTGKFSVTLMEQVSDYMHVIVRTEVNKYVANLKQLENTKGDDPSANLTEIADHNTAMLNDVIYMYLSNYVDSYIQTVKDNLPDFIESYVKSRLTGETFVDEDDILSDIPDAQSTIDSKINSEIEKIVKDYLNGTVHEAGSVGEYFAGLTESFVDSVVDKVVNNYIVEETGEGTAVGINEINSTLYSLIKAEIDEYFDDTLDDNITAYKKYMRGESVSKPEFYELIKAQVITSIMNELGCSEDDAEAAYADWENGNADYSQHLDSINASDINPTVSDFEKVLRGNKLDDVVKTVVDNLDVNSIIAGIDKDKVLLFVGSSSLGGTIDDKVAKFKSLLGVNAENGLLTQISNLTPAERIDIIEKMLPGITTPEDNLSTDEKNTLNSEIDSLAKKVVAYIDEHGDITHLVDELMTYAHGKLNDGEFDSYLRDALGLDFDVTMAHVNATMDNVALVVGNKYTEVLTEVNDALATTKTRIAAILNLVEEITIDGEDVLGQGESGLAFNLEKFIDIFNDLVAKIDDLATMSKEEMYLSYDIGIYTSLGDAEFTVTAKLGEGHDKVNKLFKLVNEYLTITQNSDGMITGIDIRVPDVFAKAILKACNSGKVPDDLKNKVFDKISETPDDIHAFINDFSIDDIISLLNYVDSKADLDGIITKHVVSRFERLDGLSVDAIEAKIEEYQGYYLKLIDYFNRAYSFFENTDIGDQLSEGVIGIYQGQGDYGAEFVLNHQQQFELIDFVYTALSKVDEDKAYKAAELLNSLLYNTEIDLDITLDVQIANIAKVTYKIPVIDENGNEAIEDKVGFLPLDADIKFFAGITTYQGVPILGWYDVNDTNGTEYEKMPDFDIVLAPIFAELGDVVITVVDKTTGSETATKVYDGNALLLTAGIYGRENAANLSYQWYKDGQKLDGQTSAQLSIYNVLDSGTYKCEITEVISGSPMTAVGETAVSITPKPVDLPSLGITWIDGDFTYGDSDIKVSVDESTVPDYLTLVGYEGNTATNAGDYKAYAEFAIKDNNANYVLKDDVTKIEYEWSVAKKKYDGVIVDFTRADSDVTYSYNKTHTINATVNSAASGIFEIESISGNTGINAGDYTAIVTVKIADGYTQNYELTPSQSTVSYPWSIERREFDLSTASWKAYAGNNELSGFEFVYDGIEKQLRVVGLPEDILAVVSYENAAATNAMAGLLASVVISESDLAALEANYSFAKESVGGVENIKMPAQQEWKILKRTVTIENAVWPSDLEFDYDGNVHEVILEGVPTDEEGKILYVYYAYDKNGNLLDTPLASAPKNAGKYKVVVMVSEGSSENYTIPAAFTSSVDFTILSKTISVSITSDYTAPFKYNNVKYSVTVSGLDALKELVDSGIITIDDSTAVYEATNAGTYTVKIVISVTDDYVGNYYFEDGESVYEYTLSWEITPQPLSVPELVVTPGQSFVYDGTEKTVSITLPDSHKNYLKLEFDEENSVFKATDADQYTVYYTIKINPDFEGKDNYSFTEITGTVTWEITKATVNLSGIKWDYEAPFVYDGEEHSVKLIVPEALNELVTLAYDEGVNAATDIGKYRAVAVIALKDSKNYKFAENTDVRQDGTVEFTLDWAIVKEIVHIGKLDWITVNPYTYDGTLKTVHPTLDLSHLSEDILAKFDVEYSGITSSINAGSFEVTVKLIPKDEAVYLDYELTADSCLWEIKKADIDISGIVFESKTVKWNGLPFSITAIGIPEGLTAQYEGNLVIGSQNTEGGEPEIFKVALYLIPDDPQNYNTPEPMYAYLTIYPENSDYDPNYPDYPGPDGPTDPDYPDIPGPDDPIDPDYPDIPGPDDPKPPEKHKHEWGDIIIIESEKVDDTYELNVIDKTNSYLELDLSELFGEDSKAVVRIAYDIHFLDKDGVQGSVTDTFKVRLLIPEKFRAIEELGVIHIKDDGSVELIDNVTRDGDYLVFDTTHFSVYAIVELNPEVTDDPIVDPGEEQKTPWLLIILIIVLVLVLLVILFIIIRKIKIRRRAKDAEEFENYDPESEELPENIKPVSPEAQLLVVENRKPERDPKNKTKKAKTYAEPTMDPEYEPEYDIEPEYADVYDSVDEEKPADQSMFFFAAAPVAVAPEKTVDSEPVNELEADDIPATRSIDGPVVPVNPRKVIKHIVVIDTNSIAKPKPKISLLPVDDEPAAQDEDKKDAVNTDENNPSVVTTPIETATVEEPIVEAPVDPAPVVDESPVTDIPVQAEIIPTQPVEKPVVKLEPRRVVARVKVKIHNSALDDVQESEVTVVAEEPKAAEEPVAEVVEPKSVEVPVADEEPKAAEEPVAEVVEPKSVEVPVADEEPKAAEEPVAEVVEPKSVEVPVADEEPKAAEEPVAEVVEPKADEEPVADEEPKAAEEPVAEVVEPKADEEPVADEEPKVAEEPVAEVVEPKADEEPVADEEPKAAEEPVAEVVEPKSVEVPVANEEPAPVVKPMSFVSGDDVAGKRRVNGQIVPVRFRTSYMSRLIQSESTVKDYYTAVKNHILSYKGVKARTSWNFESFNVGRLQCVKLNVKGSAFLVYLALDPGEYNASKYHFVDVSGKPKLDKVPMMLKVKSDRALKYAIELIDEVMKKNGIDQGKIPSEDYHMPYESTDALCDRDLVKLILPDGMVIDENTIIERIDVGEWFKDMKEESIETDAQNAKEDDEDAD